MIEQKKKEKEKVEDFFFWLFEEKKWGFALYIFSPFQCANDIFYIIKERF